MRSSELSLAPSDQVALSVAWHAVDAKSSISRSDRVVSGFAYARPPAHLPRKFRKEPVRDPDAPPLRVVASTEWLLCIKSLQACAFTPQYNWTQQGTEASMSNSTPNPIGPPPESSSPTHKHLIDSGCTCAKTSCLDTNLGGTVLLIRRIWLKCCRMRIMKSCA